MVSKGTAYSNTRINFRKLIDENEFPDRRIL